VFDRRHVDRLAQIGKIGYKSGTESSLDSGYLADSRKRGENFSHPFHSIRDKPVEEEKCP